MRYKATNWVLLLSLSGRGQSRKADGTVCATAALPVVSEVLLYTAKPHARKHVEMDYGQTISE